MHQKPIKKKCDSSPEAGRRRVAKKTERLHRRRKFSWAKGEGWFKNWNSEYKNDCLQHKIFDSDFLTPIFFAIVLNRPNFNDEFSRTSLFEDFWFSLFLSTYCKFSPTPIFSTWGVSDLVKKVVQTKNGILASLPSMFYMVVFGRCTCCSSV